MARQTGLASRESLLSSHETDNRPVGYTYAAAIAGIRVHGWMFAWVVFIGAAVFLFWLVLNDIGRLSQLETLARRLFDDDAQWNRRARRSRTRITSRPRGG